MSEGTTGLGKANVSHVSQGEAVRADWANALVDAALYDKADQRGKGDILPAFAMLGFSIADVEETSNDTKPKLSLELMEGTVFAYWGDDTEPKGVVPQITDPDIGKKPMYMDESEWRRPYLEFSFKKQDGTDTDSMVVGVIVSKDTGGLDAGSVEVVARAGDVSGTEADGYKVEMETGEVGTDELFIPLIAVFPVYRIALANYEQHDTWRLRFLNLRTGNIDMTSAGGGEEEEHLNTGDETKGKAVLVTDPDTNATPSPGPHVHRRIKPKEQTPDANPITVNYSADGQNIELGFNKDGVPPPSSGVTGEIDIQDVDSNGDPVLPAEKLIESTNGLVTAIKNGLTIKAKLIDLCDENGNVTTMKVLTID